MYQNRNAVSAIIPYVWKLLEANLDWDLDDYSGAVPIIPSSQQPELMQTGKPFLVFGSAIHPAPHLYALRTEAITFSIYATTVGTVNAVANLLADTFDRQDEAAADVNDWLEIEALGRSVNRHVSFGSIRTVMVEKAEPADEEGGFYAALVMLEMKYIINNDTIETSGFAYP